MTTVTYTGFLGRITHHFPTLERAHQWARQAAAPPPLISAMRCYVASKLGDEIEVPKELT